MHYDYCFLVYDSGLPLSYEDYVNLTYRQKHKFLKWMRAQKDAEKAEREQLANQ